MTTTELPTTLPTSPPEEGATGVIVIAVAVSVVILVIGGIAFKIWWVRRKTGDWPKFITRRRRPPIHLNPYGKSYPGLHNNNNNTTNRTITPHLADFRTPVNLTERKVYSVSGGELESNENLSVDQNLIANKNRESSEKKSVSAKKNNLSVPDLNSAFISKTKSPRDCVDIGMYPDRTLPATLMMTSESKNKLFFNEETNRRRSNSATLTRNQAKLLSSKNQNLHKFNDFAGQSDIGRYSQNKKNPRPVTSSRLSNKPSNTSDYVSDFDTGSDRRNLRKVGKKRAVDRKKRASDCDSAIHECLTINHSQLTTNNQRSKRQNRVTLRENSFQDNQGFDDRTESQHNTWRKENFTSISVLLNGNEIIEDQISDTESMVGRKLQNKLKSKQSQYESDVEVLNSGKSPKRKKKLVRSRSEGWHSEPEITNVNRKSSRIKGSRQNQRRLSSSNSLNKKQLRVRYSKSTENLDESDCHYFRMPNKSSPKSRKQNLNKKRGSYYDSASLKSPIGGMVIEMPIYSQSTWAGPGTSFHYKKKSQAKKRGKRSGRKLSIGGGGKYVMEYGTLPVDLSKLPKGLVDKIGGHPDQLLEPIDQLNFEELCRPMPSVLESDGRHSARHLVVENLPLNHCDRELLANTYEYENTGLVTTDL